MAYVPVPKDLNAVKTKVLLLSLIHISEPTRH